MRVQRKNQEISKGNFLQAGAREPPIPGHRNGKATIQVSAYTMVPQQLTIRNNRILMANELRCHLNAPETIGITTEPGLGHRHPWNVGVHLGGVLFRLSRHTKCSRDSYPFFSLRVAPHLLVSPYPFTVI